MSTFRNNISIALSIMIYITSAVTHILDTTLAAGNGQDGNMFDIFAINTVEITQFDVHCIDATEFEIYVATAEDQGYSSISMSPGDWTLIHTESVTCNSEGTLTILSSFDTSGVAIIKAGDVRGFYVTATGAGYSYYTNGGGEGNVYTSDSNIEFKEGLGKLYPFGASWSPRIWNGRIHYTTDIIPAPCASCVSDCTDVLNGNYASCNGDNVYVTCSNNIIHDNRACPANLVWDDERKACRYNSVCVSKRIPQPCDGCVSGCTDVLNGNYASCNGDHVYVTCSNGIIYDNRPCPADNLVWNDAKRICDYESDCSP